MLSVADQYLIRTYLVRLRKELAIQGMSQRRIEAVLDETSAHLQEAMSAAAPTTDLAAERVIDQFGNAPAMAKSLAAQEEQSNARRRFLWPAIYFVVAYFILVAIRYSAGPLFHVWIGTLFLLFSAGVLATLGFFARRPVLAQFAVICGILVVAQTTWYASTSIPVERYGRFQPVGRGDAAQFVEDVRGNIAKESEVIAKVRRGQTIFVDSNTGKIVPAEFTYNGNYMTPEALREVALGIAPEEIQPFLFARSWKDSLVAWDKDGVSFRGPGAESVLRMEPQSILADQQTLANFEWMRHRPLIDQIGIDLKMAAFPVLALGAMALLATNAGWLLRLMLRAMGRARRRLLFASDPIYTAALPEV